MQIAKSVYWHSEYGEKVTRAPARSILKLLDRDMETRTIRALADGWGINTWPRSERRDLAEIAHVKLAMELVSVLPIAGKLVGFLNDRLIDLNEFGHSLDSAHVFIGKIISQNVPIALAVFESHLTNNLSPIAKFAAFALGALLQRDYHQAQTKIELILQKSDAELGFVARAFSAHVNLKELTDTDRRILRRIFASVDKTVLNSASRILRGLFDTDKLFAIELMTTGGQALLKAAGHDCLMFLCNKHLVQFDLVTDDLAGIILKSFVELERLEDPFVHEFLKRLVERRPGMVVDLLKERLMSSKMPFGWGNRAKPLNILSNPQGPKMLRDLLDWALTQNGDFFFFYRFADLLGGAFGLNDSGSCAVMAAWVENGGEDHFLLLSALIGKAPSRFIFDQGLFITRVLAAARRVSRKAHENMTSEIQTSANSGVKTVSADGACAEDVKVRDHAQAILSSLSQSDPAYTLYRELNERAEQEIRRERERQRALDSQYADD